ncbi:MAG TPA: hypothetical protein ENG58_01155 [Thermotogales bacterium]|nr:hypothetical protein [Thermotogales bacterium]
MKLRRDEFLDRIYDPDFLRMRRKVEYYLGLLKRSEDSRMVESFFSALRIDREDTKILLESPLHILSKLSHIDPQDLMRIMEDYSLDHIDIFTAVFLDSLKKMEKNLEYEYFSDLVRKLKKIDLVSMDEGFMSELVEELATMRTCELELLRENLITAGVHPYIVRILTDLRSPRYGAVVDGSNVYHAGLKPSISNFDRLFHSMAKFKFILFPIKFVFDRNILHILRWDEKIIFERSFKRSKNVFFHSPADELILKLARENGFFVISRDRFKDQDVGKIMILTFDNHFNILERKPK